MDFGLGLVLSFTDNASAGIQSALGSLQNLTSEAENVGNSLNQIASLSAFSSMATNIGSSMTQMGSSIISTFSGIISKINETGQTLSYAESQFSTLYKDTGKTGKDVLADVQDYAEKSIFDFENLIPVVTMLKANGIEAFDAITTSSGKTTQTLMDYASDLAAFNPQMMNAYGTGIQAAMGSLNEYIAEGNTMSLRRGASIDILQMLGEDKGKTIEERSRQVADLIEKLGMVGMTAGMAGTPMQRLSNMGDVLFQVLGKISSSGVYDEFNKIIETVSEWVFSIPDAELNTIANTIGGALVTLIKPVQVLAGYVVKLADSFKSLLTNNPLLAKFAVIATAVSGALLVIGGVALKFAGTVGYMTLMMSQFGQSFSVIKTAMMTGSKQILGSLIPLTLALGLMYVVWRNDLFGIRSSVQQFTDEVATSFIRARNLVGGSLQGMQIVLQQYDTSHSFFDGLTLGIARVMLLGRALAEGWNNFTLSDEVYLKAERLGLLPLIEAIFNLKYRFDNFKAGFIKGWQDISERVQTYLKGLVDRLNSGSIFDGILSSVTEFMRSLSNNDADAWYKFGYSFAEFTAKALAFAVAMRVLSKVIKTVSSVAGTLFKGFSTIVKIVEFVLGVPAKLGQLGSTISTVFSGAITAITTLARNVLAFFQLVSESGLSATLQGLFGTATTIAAGIVSIVAGVIMSIASFVSQWQNGFNVVKAIILTIGSLLVALGLTIAGVVGGWIPFVVALVVAGVAELVIAVKDHWEQVKSVIGGIAEWVYTYILQPIISFFSPAMAVLGQLWEGFSNVVITVISGILNFIRNLIGGVQSIWQTIVSFIAPAVATFIQLKDTIGEFCSFVGQVFSDLWTAHILPVFTAIGGFILFILSHVQNAFLTVWGQIWAFIGPVITNMATMIFGVFTSIFTTIMGILNALWAGIVGVVNGILTIVLGVLSNAFQAVSNIIMGILNFIMGKNEAAKANFSQAWQNIKGMFSSVLSGIWQIITSRFNSIWNIIKSILTGITSTFSTVLTGLVNIATSTFTNLYNSIVDKLTNAYNFVKGIVDKIKNVFHFTWTLPELKLPHVSVTGGEAPFGIAGKGSLPQFSVSWYKEGGVFNKPNIIGVGEAGTEAVMPLKSNTEWIGVLANMLTSEMSEVMTPTSTDPTLGNYENGGGSYVTSSNQNNVTTNNNNVDRSITIATGAIQIVAQNSSDAEAERLAKKILGYIKRQQEIDDMLAYHSV